MALNVRRLASHDLDNLTVQRGALVNPDEYSRGIDQRLKADGCEIIEQDLPPEFKLVGYRSEFRLRWMASKVHLFTVVAEVPVATSVDLERHTDAALRYAVAQKGRFRGLHGGIAAIPVLLAPVVEPNAVEFAQKRLIRKFGAFAWPSLVDQDPAAPRG